MAFLLKGRMPFTQGIAVVQDINQLPQVQPQSLYAARPAETEPHRPLGDPQGLINGIGASATPTDPAPSPSLDRDARSNHHPIPPALLGLGPSGGLRPRP